jgi:hypothetical protein
MYSFETSLDFQLTIHSCSPEDRDSHCQILCSVTPNEQNRLQSSSGKLRIHPEKEKIWYLTYTMSCFTSSKMYLNFLWALIAPKWLELSRYHLCALRRNKTNADWKFYMLLIKKMGVYEHRLSSYKRFKFMIKYEKHHSYISFASGTSKTSELIILCHNV